MSDDLDSRAEASRLRAQEVNEEKQYVFESREERRERIEKVNVTRTARAMRGWVLKHLIPDAVLRMYDIGMGVQTFDTPTAMGNVVQIEAPPMVQQRALAALIGLGMPTQIGLTDDQPDRLPGVVALGPLDLDSARAQVHGDRYVSPEAHARLLAAAHNGGVVPTGPIEDAPVPVPMEERIANGEFQVIEVEEGVGVASHSSDDAPPGPIADMETPEKAALRRHRERMAARNGVRVGVPAPNAHTNGNGRR